MNIILKELILPSTLILLTAIVGLALLSTRCTRKWGTVFSVAAFSAYLVFASGPVAFLLLGHLEFKIAPSSVAEREGVRTIVLLAAYAEADNSIPLSSRVNGPTAFRLLETMSLFHAEPESTVVVSGGGAAPEIMRDMLVSAGIPAERILVDGDSYSTFESARRLTAMLGTSPFLLVTSAGHMPRAMGVFLKAGMRPRPAPTHYVTKQNYLAIRYLPSPLHLSYSDWAVTEYAALLWYRLHGWI